VVWKYKQFFLSTVGEHKWFGSVNSSFSPGEKELFILPNHLCSPSVERKNCLHFQTTCVHARWRERTVYTSKPLVFTLGGEKELFTLPNHLYSPSVERENCLYFRTTCIHPRWRERTVYTSEPPVFTLGGEKELFILPNHLCSRVNTGGSEV
jgi:hypothetical protein